MNISRHHLLGRLLSWLPGKGSTPGNFQRRRSSPGRRRPVPRGSHVLDVLVKSTRQQQLERSKRWRHGLKWGGLIAATVALAASSHQAVARYFWQNPEFQLASSAEIRTNGTLTHDDIMRAADLTEATHIYAVDLRLAREKLEALPNVRHATVERELPGRLVIEIDERLPVMWLSCDQPSLQPFTTNSAHGACLLDEDGHLFVCRELRTELMRLPVLHLRRLPNSQAGVQLNSAAVQTGLDLLTHLRQAFGSRALDVVEIDAPNDWSLVAKFTNDLSVTFGYDELGQQIDRLLKVIDHSSERNLRLGTVNMLPRKNVPVTFLEDAVVPVNAGPSALDGVTLPVSSRPTPPRPTAASEEAAQLEAILGGGR